MSSTLLHKTWWGEEFVQALEAYIDPGRLQRGKAYRTDKRVLDFDITNNEVRATIRGNINPYFGVTKEPKYKVVLKFNQIKPAQWQSIIKTISGNALWLSKLMLNEIPSTIEQAFVGDPLLPSSYKSVKASCTCPDGSNPCKHIAGVYYRIAAMLDVNPMLLFQLRGLAPEKLHQELKKSELGQAFSEHLTLPANVEMQYQQQLYTPTHIKREKTTPAQQKTQTSRHQNAKLNQFWSMPISTQTSMPVPATPEGSDNMMGISAALIKKQGDYPEFWTNNHSFISAMELFYAHTRKKNSKDLL